MNTRHQPTIFTTQDASRIAFELYGLDAKARTLPGERDYNFHPLDATFHWGRASISGAYALGLILAGLLGVPIGSLVDRRGARLLTSAGSALAGLALFGLARVDALWQFYLLWSGGLAPSYWQPSASG